MKWPSRRVAVVAGVTAIAVAAVVAAIALRSSVTGEPAPPARADAVPYDGRSPREPGASKTRVLLALQRPALGALRTAGRMDATAQRAYVTSLRKEAAALRGALRARGVRLERVVGYERVFNGFAATVRTRDLAAISSLGVRAQPVRRFYPAVSEPAAAPLRAARLGEPPPPEQQPIALLASGVARGPGVETGVDVVDRDEDAAPGADPRDPRRREAGGTAVAGVLTGSGERVRPIRVAGLRAGPRATSAVEEYGTSDELLAGLERVVDPDDDGDASDRAAVALVAVSSPYAGFARSPEAEAVRAASGLGTLVVAPAGNEGRARPPSGTIASPGSAPAALAVGALSAEARLPRVKLRASGDKVGEAAVLAGAPSAGALPRSPTVTAADLLEPGAPRLQDTLAVIRAEDAPGAQAAAAASAGARVVLLAEPREGRILPALPAGRSSVPVLGVTGEAARTVLDLPAGSSVKVGRVLSPGRTRRPSARPLSSAFSSRGPTLDGTPKPDLVAAGAAATTDAAGRPAIAGGTAVAAALVAVQAARSSRAQPEAAPAELRAALMARAGRSERKEPVLPATAGGAGVLQGPEPASSTRPQAPLVATPLPLTGPRIRLRRGSGTGAVRLATVPDPGSPRVTVTPSALEPPGTATVLAAPGSGPFATGTLIATGSAGRRLLMEPFAIASGPAPPVAVGALRLTRRGGSVTGVRFTLGAFDRGDPLGSGTAFQPARRLELELARADGRSARRLTPPGGARELLPAEYAYTLPRAALRSLAGARVRFRLRALAPRQTDPTEARSPAFAAR